jgi:gamma-glutamylcyclotransferase (GGCT)/AIG2-like uncharacterized protein YtfP
MPIDLIHSSWEANEWSAFGTVLLGLGAITAGAWTLFNYRRSRRAEAAHWLQGVFRDFYLEDRFRKIKLLMEYEYPEKLAPLLERRVTDRHVPVTAEETALLDQLDMLLNYFEHVIYLEREGHFKQRDRQAVFEYWFDLMGADERAAIRRYAAWFGFERVALALKCQKEDYIALYGSLMQGEEIRDKPDLTKHLRLIGKATLEGSLFDLGEYPGMVPGKGRVCGELYQVVDREAFEVLDRFERYDASNLDDSLYIRRAVRLVSPSVDAWVYMYNGEISEAPHITSGDWSSHQATRISDSSAESPALV